MSTTPIQWSRRDKRRAQSILRQLADHIGGWQGIADELGLSADSSRATVFAWHRRGRVPLAHAAPVRDLAVRNQVPCTLSELSPQAKHLEKLV